MPKAAALALLATSAFAQTATKHAANPALHPVLAAPRTTLATAPAATLPVTSVSLYKNGVGFFEHITHVTGNQAVTLDLTTAQLNDVLQSLTAVDLNGGRIAGAGYNSTTPLDQQLRSLPLALGDDPTSDDLFNAIRGAHVEVTGSGAAFTGRVLSLEFRAASPAKPNADGTAIQSEAQKRYLTLVAENGGVRSVELTPSTEVRLLDQQLHTDLARYLETVAGNRTGGLRHLTLEDNGPTASRELHVSYISEVPIWKSTYRLLLTDSAATANKPSVTLQGWAVVDNTVGTDWTNVHLTLVAGSPQSFLQPLSQPIYARRPEVPISQDAQFTPQTFESGDTVMNGLSAPTVSMGMGSGGGIGYGNGNGIGPGSGAGIAGGVYRPQANASAPMIPPPPPPPPPTISYEDAASASITPQTTTAAFDDYFTYAIKDPVTIRKNESALVPILQAKLDAERVTLWTPSTARAVRALWVTNNTGMTLDRGSFSIVENGSFGGEGLLDPIHAGERRLLSYAADDAVRVTLAPSNQAATSTVSSVTASKGILILHSKEVSTTEYLVHNGAPETRTVVLEHPKRNGFTLDATPTAAKPQETTDAAYRFSLQAPSGVQSSIKVIETRPVNVQYQLTRSDEQQIETILNTTHRDPKLEAALQPILAARRKVADATNALNQTNQRLNQLRAEEERQRANITALKDADKGAVARFVNDLNRTEDSIAQQSKELETRQAAFAATQADLTAQIMALQIDETL